MIPAALADAVAAAEIAPLAQAVALIRPWLCDIRWLERWIEQGCVRLRDDPMHLPPVRASRNGRVRHLVFARTERVWISVTIVDPSTEPGDRLHMSGRHALIRPLDRALTGERFRLAGETIVPAGPVHCPVGAVVAIDERCEAVRLAPLPRPVMMLRAQVAPPGPVFARSFRVETGQPCASATVDEEHARTLMLLSLLRLQGRTDAAPHFARALEAPLPAQRWAVMREYLALDTAAALPALRQMADSEPDGHTRTVARRTLAMVATDPCPA